jgi:hypothetical protein
MNLAKPKPDENSPSPHGLRKVLSLLSYADAGLLVRIARSLILVEHYWVWSRIHFRQDGPKDVYQRIFRRLKLGFKRSDKITPAYERDSARSHEEFELSVPTQVHLNGKPSLMILCPDVIGTKRVGLAVRHWEIARAMSQKGYHVTLVTPRPSDLHGDLPFAFVPAAGPKTVKELCDRHDAVLYQGSVIREFPFLSTRAKKLIVDLVCPVHLEDLDKEIESYQGSLSLVGKWLECGDFYICGNERQRDYWLGLLSSTGKILELCKRGDKTLRGLIDVVPFGIPDEKPTKPKELLRGVIPGIDRDSIVYLWWGGIWDWLDPDTPIEAAIAAHKVNPAIRLIFSNLAHPNGEVTPAARRSVELAKSLGGLNSVVFFNEHPVPYDDRGAFLLSADVGLISQRPNLETRFAARTRALDYWWAGLPILCAEGDEASDVVKQQEIGMVVRGDVNSWVEGFVRCAQPAFRNTSRANISSMTDSLRWSSAIEPIERFCCTTGTA